MTNKEQIVLILLFLSLLGLPGCDSERRPQDPSTLRFSPAILSPFLDEYIENDKSAAPNRMPESFDFAVSDRSICILWNEHLFCGSNWESPVFGKYGLLQNSSFQLKQDTELVVEDQIICAQKPRTSLSCWGDSVPRIADQMFVDHVDAGGDYRLCVSTRSKVTCFMGSVIRKDVIREVFSFPEEVRDLSVGRKHFCAVTSSGNVHCSKLNPQRDRDINRIFRIYGQSDPPELGVVSQIVAGGTHSCALLKSGKVECWGAGTKQMSMERAKRKYNDKVSKVGAYVKNRRDELMWKNGGWRDEVKYTPNFGQSAPPDIEFKKLVAGDFFTCGLSRVDGLECWGVVDRDSEIPATGSTKFTDLAAGAGTLCATTGVGQLRCWGDGSQLGRLVDG